MIKVLTTPAPDIGGDTSIGNVIRNYASRSQGYGIEFVGDGEYDVEIVHAGVKPFNDPGGRNISMVHGLYWGDRKLSPYEKKANANIVDSVRHASAVVVPSSWVAKPFERDMHLSPHVIPHGINWEEWQGSDKGEHMVLWAKNRSDDVCDPRPAVGLATMFPDTRFVSTFGKTMSNMAVTGPLPKSTMKSVIKSATIYLSSTEETFGITTLEAMASGCPVLGYAYGGNLDMVQTGVNGYLAKPGDLSDLGRGLVYCLENWQELSDGAVKSAKLWTWEAVMDKLAPVITSVAQQKTETFAIIIPCFNKRRTIRQTVQSAVNQDTPCEVIVVDDGSTDGSTNELADLDVRVIRQKNQGVAHARNAGVTATGADFIVCLDGDDLIAPEFVSTCFRALTKDNSAGAAFSGITQLLEDGSRRPSDWPNGFNYERQLEQANQVPTCCMFRRELWERLGGYRQRYAPKGAGSEDAEFWLRMGASGYKAVQATTEGMFVYRLNSGGTSEQGYAEYPWLSWHPWTTDGKHPFASIARSVDAAHTVRKYALPSVSVIIPVAPSHIKNLVNALDSLEAQTFREWEVIVVLDGQPSPEDKVSLLKAYPYARVFSSSGDARGAGWARNMGIALSTAPLLYFLDADDWLEPTCLSKHVEAHRLTGQLVYSDYYGINPPDLRPNETVIKDEGGHRVVVGSFPDYDCRAAQAQPNSRRPYEWCSINVLIPRETLGEIRFDETLPSLEDWEFLISLAKSGACFHRIDEPLWVYNFHLGQRRRDGQKSRAKIIESFEIKEIAMGCNCKDDEVEANMNLNEVVIPGGYLLAEYRPVTKGKHPVWGVVKPKENYGMKQVGNRFLVKVGDIALMGGKFVCAYCGKPFATNARNRSASCNCGGQDIGQENLLATAAATGVPMPTRIPSAVPRVVPAPASSVVRDNADKPVLRTQENLDDFTSIHGVGRATADILHKAGIRTFTQLGRMTEDMLRVYNVPRNSIPALMEHIDG